MTEVLLAAERRRRSIRIVLFGVILVTLPFYCLGFILWATGPQNNDDDITLTATFTLTPIGQDISQTPTLTQLPLLATTTSISPILPTPGQFNPPPPVVIPPTAFIPPTTTAVTIPTSTTAPTLTPIPTNTSPPTNTPIPTNTEPPPPTLTPIPSDTPLPFPTDPPPDDGGGTGDSGGDTGAGTA